MLQEKVQILKVQYLDNKKWLEQRNKELQQEVDNYKEEIEKNNQQIGDLKGNINKNTQLYEEIISSRPPSKVYVVLLKERWCKYQLYQLKKQLPYSIITPKDFMEAC